MPVAKTTSGATASMYTRQGPIQIRRVSSNE
jgi:hypothetical protein